METRTSYCKFNKMIDCDTKACGNCGWHPEVREQRLDEWRKQQEIKAAKSNG